jgi:Flp pilus assembly protein TadD
MINSHTRTLPLRYGQAFDWDGPGTEIGFARALAVDPDDQDILGNYAGHLVLRERFDEAIELTREAERLDPGWIMPPTAVGLWLLAARRYEEALAQVHRAAELEPRFFVPPMFLGDGYRFMGRSAEAAVWYERAIGLVGREPMLLGRLAAAAADQGDLLSAERLVEQLDAMARRGSDRRVHFSDSRTSR